MRQRDERGDALSVAILFFGVFVTVLLGVHVVIVAIGRTTVSSAADAAVAAAQAAGPGLGSCEEFWPNQAPSVRECEGAAAAVRSIDAAGASVQRRGVPRVIEDLEDGLVRAYVHGAIVSPVLGTIELHALACGPLDDVASSELTGMEAWQC